jgi:hypothetical protein
MYSKNIGKFNRNFGKKHLQLRFRHCAKRIANFAFGRPSGEEYDLLEVPIERCVHFCAFPYGKSCYNPYESYLIDIVDGKDVINARRRFIDFLLYYRPRDMGEALGVTLSRKYPLWLYPWHHPWEPYSKVDFKMNRGWWNKPSTFRDILTQFSDEGILSFRVEEEFVWLEKALFSIVDNGYNPRKFQNYVSGLELRGDNQSVFILIDGNHRVGALSALGHKTVTIRRKRLYLIIQENYKDWYGVKNGFYADKDALDIFIAYFTGNRKYRISSRAARIIAPTDWKNLYSI